MSNTPFLLAIIILATAIAFCIVAKKKINKAQSKYHYTVTCYAQNESPENLIAIRQFEHKHDAIKAMQEDATKAMRNYDEKHNPNGIQIITTIEKDFCEFHTPDGKQRMVWHLTSFVKQSDVMAGKVNYND